MPWSWKTSSLDVLGDLIVEVTTLDYSSVNGWWLVIDVGGSGFFDPQNPL